MSQEGKLLYSTTPLLVTNQCLSLQRTTLAIVCPNDNGFQGTVCGWDSAFGWRWTIAVAMKWREEFKLSDTLFII